MEQLNAAVVAYHPAEGDAKRTPFEGKQQSNRHQFAGLQVRLRVLSHSWHLIVHHIEQRCDQLLSSHGTGFSLESSLPQG